MYPITPEEKERKIEEFIEERRRTAALRRAETPDLSDDRKLKVFCSFSMFRF